MTEGMCITCRDQRVAVPGVGEEVSVELVEAGVGDVVHARVAIGRLHEGS